MLVEEFLPYGEISVSDMGVSYAGIIKGGGGASQKSKNYTAQEILGQISNGLCYIYAFLTEQHDVNLHLGFRVPFFVLFEIQNI